MGVVIGIVGESVKEFKIPILAGLYEEFYIYRFDLVRYDSNDHHHREFICDGRHARTRIVSCIYLYVRRCIYRSKPVGFLISVVA